MATPPLTLAEIVDAQTTAGLSAHEQADVYELNSLIRIQRQYAAKAAQLEALHCVCEERSCELVLRGQLSQVKLRLEQNVMDVLHEALVDCLRKDLLALEVVIVRIQARIESDMLEDAAHGFPEHLVLPRLIVDLCTTVPAVPANYVALASSRAFKPTP